MTIQDAIKSGKPFKRMGQDFYYSYIPTEVSLGLAYLLSESSIERFELYLEDIIATDWEIKKD